MKNQTLRAAGRWIARALLVALAACNPALNWRDVRLPSGHFRGLLPCKAEASDRAVELAGAPVQMAQLSCTVDGTTFALVEAQLPDAAQVPAALSHWRVAALQNVRAFAPMETDLTVPGVIGPVRQVSANGQHPGGGALQVRAAWWAVGPRLHHAVVYSSTDVNARTHQEIHESFFGSLKVVNP